MTARRAHRHATVAATGVTVLLLTFTGCTDEDAPVTSPPPSPDAKPTEPRAYGDVRPDISPQGYAALGCSMHVSQATLDPADLISRRDPREAAYTATWSLLVAAGLREEAAFGALVEPASGIQLVHPQGDWDRVASHRSTVTRECRDVERVPVGPHVYAAYACRILGRLSDVAPTAHDLAPDRVTPAADELEAVTHLARAAAAHDDQYRRLGRAGTRLHGTVTTDAGTQAHATARQQVAATCAELGTAG